MREINLTKIELDSRKSNDFIEEPKIEESIHTSIFNQVEKDIANKRKKLKGRQSKARGYSRSRMNSGRINAISFDSKSSGHFSSNFSAKSIYLMTQEECMLKLESGFEWKKEKLRIELTKALCKYNHEYDKSSHNSMSFISEIEALAKRNIPGIAFSIAKWNTIVYCEEILHEYNIIKEKLKEEYIRKIKAKKRTISSDNIHKAKSIEKEALKYVNDQKLGDQLQQIVQFLVKKLKKFGSEFTFQIQLLERMIPKNNKEDELLIK